MSYLLTLLLCLALGPAIEKITLGFSLHRVQSTDVPSLPPIEPTEQINQILSQPFYLLDAGSECFVFSSADHSTVLKLFKLDKLRYIYLRKALLSPTRYRNDRLQRTFNSNWLSHTLLPQETALLYTHLSPTKTIKSTLTLYDRCHIAHTLDPNPLYFVLQKKGSSLFTHLQTLIDADQIELAKQGIDSFIDLLLSRCLKGVADHDSLCRNFGFVEGRAFECDTGAFSLLPQMKQRWLYTQELLYATQELREWLKSRSPELALYLKSQIEGKI